MHTQADPRGVPRILVATFANELRVDSEGRDELLGLFDTAHIAAEVSDLKAPLPPLAYPACVFVQIATDGLKGEHSVRLEYFDPSGARLPGQLLMKQRTDEHDGFKITGRTKLLLPAGASPGTYELRIFFDDELLGVLPLKVVITKTPMSLVGAGLPPGLRRQTAH